MITMFGFAVCPIRDAPGKRCIRRLCVPGTSAMPWTSRVFTAVSGIVRLPTCQTLGVQMCGTDTPNPSWFRKWESKWETTSLSWIDDSNCPRARVCLLIFDVNSLKHRVAVCIWLAPEGGACHVFRAWFPSSNSFGVFSHSEGFKAKLHIAHARDERCKDTLAAVNVSGYSGPGLDETVDLNTKLIDQLEEEEEQMTAASEAIENSGLWRMMKKVKVETEDVLLPVPSHYKLVKMPDAKQVSLDFKAATSMYYQGTCIPQEAYLAKHTVARVSQKNYKNIPVGDVVKIERVVRSLDPKDPTNVFVRHGGLQKRMRLQDLSFDAWSSGSRFPRFQWPYGLKYAYWEAMSEAFQQPTFVLFEKKRQILQTFVQDGFSWVKQIVKAEFFPQTNEFFSTSNPCEVFSKFSLHFDPKMPTKKFKTEKRKKSYLQLFVFRNTMNDGDVMW